MKQFLSFIKKEYFHIIRDKRTMFILLLMPVIQLLIFGFAITTEINNIPFAVLDNSKDANSQQFIQHFNNSKYFSFYSDNKSQEEIDTAFKFGKIKMAIIIPPYFGNHLLHGGISDIQVLLDASDPNEASTISNYTHQIVQQYQQSILANEQIPYVIKPEIKMLYNPQMKSAYNFVPGLMGLILMLICAMMTSISIVREKEQGTMEILLVSPIKPLSIVLAKAVPYLAIAMLDVISILLISFFILKVPITGNIILILTLCTIFTLSALSLGLLISTITNTQQAAMLISAVGLMLPTILLSGLIFPIENMPAVLRLISNLIPAKWFIMAIKDTMIKGLGFTAIWKQCVILICMTIVLLFISIKKFKNRL